MAATGHTETQAPQERQEVWEDGSAKRGATVSLSPRAIAPRTFMPCSSLHALTHLHAHPAHRRKQQALPVTPLHDLAAVSYNSWYTIKSLESRVTGYVERGLGRWALGLGLGILEFGVHSLEFTVWHLEFEVHSLEFEVCSLEFGVRSWVLGVR